MTDDLRSATVKGGLGSAPHKCVTHVMGYLFEKQRIRAAARIQFESPSDIPLAGRQSSVQSCAHYAALSVTANCAASAHRNKSFCISYTSSRQQLALNSQISHI